MAGSCKWTDYLYFRASVKALAVVFDCLSLSGRDGTGHHTLIGVLSLSLRLAAYTYYRVSALLSVVGSTQISIYTYAPLSTWRLSNRRIVIPLRCYALRQLVCRSR